MPYWSKDSKSARTALSEYESALFKKILEKDPVEKVLIQPANDSHEGCSLSSLFAIFH